MSKYNVNPIDQMLLTAMYEGSLKNYSEINDIKPLSIIPEYISFINLLSVKYSSFIMTHILDNAKKGIKSWTFNYDDFKEDYTFDKTIFHKEDFRNWNHDYVFFKSPKDCCEILIYEMIQRKELPKFLSTKVTSIAGKGYFMIEFNWNI